MDGRNTGHSSSAATASSSTTRRSTRSGGGTASTTATETGGGPPKPPPHKGRRGRGGGGAAAAAAIAVAGPGRRGKQLNKTKSPKVTEAPREDDDVDDDDDDNVVDAGGLGEEPVPRGPSAAENRIVVVVEDGPGGGGGGGDSDDSVEPIGESDRLEIERLMSADSESMQLLDAVMGADDGGDGGVAVPETVGRNDKRPRRSSQQRCLAGGGALPDGSTSDPTSGDEDDEDDDGFFGDDVVGGGGGVGDNGDGGVGGAGGRSKDLRLEEALNGQEPTVCNLILAAIGVMKSRKARPDSKRICNWIHRQYGKPLASIHQELERLVAAKELSRVDYKGSSSYRIVGVSQLSTTPTSSWVSAGAGAGAGAAGVGATNAKGRRAQFGGSGAGPAMEVVEPLKIPQPVFGGFLSNSTSAAPSAMTPEHHHPVPIPVPVPVSAANDAHQGLLQGLSPVPVSCLTSPTSSTIAAPSPVPVPIPTITLRTLVLDLLAESGITIIEPTTTISLNFIRSSIERTSRNLNKSVMLAHFDVLLSREIGAGNFCSVGDNLFKLPPNGTPYQPPESCSPPPPPHLPQLVSLGSMVTQLQPPPQSSAAMSIASLLPTVPSVPNGMMDHHPVMIGANHGGNHHPAGPAPSPFRFPGPQSPATVIMTPPPPPPSPCPIIIPVPTSSSSAPSPLTTSASPSSVRYGGPNLQQHHHYQPQQVEVLGNPTSASVVVVSSHLGLPPPAAGTLSTTVPPSPSGSSPGGGGGLPAGCDPQRMFGSLLPTPPPSREEKSDEQKKNDLIFEQLSRLNSGMFKHKMSSGGNAASSAAAGSPSSGGGHPYSSPDGGAASNPGRSGKCKKGKRSNSTATSNHVADAVAGPEMTSGATSQRVLTTATTTNNFSQLLTSSPVFPVPIPVVPQPCGPELHGGQYPVVIKYENTVEEMNMNDEMAATLRKNQQQLAQMSQQLPLPPIVVSKCEGLLGHGHDEVEVNAGNRKIYYSVEPRVTKATGGAKKRKASTTPPVAGFLASNSPAKLALGGGSIGQAKNSAAVMSTPGSIGSHHHHHHHNNVISPCIFCGSNMPKLRGSVTESLLKCCDCINAVHPSCMEFSDRVIRKISSMPWQCTNCKTCQMCKTSKDKGSMLICDHCDRGFHMACHRPILTKRPDGGWECFLCTTAVEPEAAAASTLPGFINSPSTTPTAVVVALPAVGSNPGGPPKSGGKAAQQSMASTGKKELLTKGHHRQQLRTPDENQKNNKPNGLNESCFLPSLPLHLHPRSGHVPENWEDYKVDPAIPDVSGWTPGQLRDHFVKLGFPENICKLFIDQEIDGGSVLLLHRTDVIMNLGLKLGPALKVYHQVKKLQTRRNLPEN